MTKDKACAHLACGCEARAGSRYCSTECERAAATAESECPCKHDACAAEDAEERSIDGNQGEGNREADRRYRKGATEFARTHDTGKKA